MILILKSCLGSPCSEDKCVEACPEGWEANGDHCYFFGDEKKNWTAAEDFCREEGGHLATVNTNDTKEFVLEGLTSKNLSSSLVAAWIGGNDIGEEGMWKWKLEVDVVQGLAYFPTGGTVPGDRCRWRGAHVVASWG